MAVELITPILTVGIAITTTIFGNHDVLFGRTMSLNELLCDYRLSGASKSIDCATANVAGQKGGSPQEDVLVPVAIFDQFTFIRKCCRTTNREYDLKTSDLYKTNPIQVRTSVPLPESSAVLACGLM